MANGPDFWGRFTLKKANGEPTTVGWIAISLTVVTGIVTMITATKGVLDNYPGSPNPAVTLRPSLGWVRDMVKDFQRQACATTLKMCHHTQVVCDDNCIIESRPCGNEWTARGYQNEASRAVVQDCCGTMQDVRDRALEWFCNTIQTKASPGDSLYVEELGRNLARGLNDSLRMTPASGLQKFMESLDDVVVKLEMCVPAIARQAQ